MLAETPLRLAAVTAGMASAELNTSPTPDEWSANQVLAHLRACADMWGGAIATIIAAKDRPTIQAVNPRSWIKRTDYPEQEFHSSLAAFAAQRSTLLAVLEPLPPEGWSRAATVLGAGRPLERTALDYAQRMAIHERPHIKQIGRIVTTLHRMPR
jgi:hypothetical protein